VLRGIEAFNLSFTDVCSSHYLTVTQHYTWSKCDILSLNIHSDVRYFIVRHDNIISNQYIHTITLNIIKCKDNISQHTDLRGSANLGYVHNDWLLTLFIDNSLTIVHYTTKYATVSFTKSA
jgi:hypothetical protein